MILNTHYRTPNAASPVIVFLNRIRGTRGEYTDKVKGLS